MTAPGRRGWRTATGRAAEVGKLRGITRALAVCTAAGALLLGGGCALIQPPTAAGADADASLPSTTRAALILTVDAPTPLRNLLERHLDLARLQQLPANERLGNGELNRLIAAAPSQARELLQTEGYFDAQVSVQRENDGRSATSTASQPRASQASALTPARVRLQVQPGPPTRVTERRGETEGALARRASVGDADALALQQTLQTVGALRPGQVFRNADWAASKQQLLTRLRSAGYAAATLSGSSAAIDASTQTARLMVVLDSGPLFGAGPVVVTGLQRHDEAMVRHLAGFGEGAALTEERLLAYQDRLQKTLLFQSISVGFEPDPAGAAQTPVRVRLTELPLQQATVGVGVSANTGPRVTLEHLHRRPFDWPVVAYNKLEWARDSQSWAGDFQTHPGAGFYRNLLGVQIDRLRSDTDVVLSQRLRLGRTQDTPRLERLYFLELLRSRQAELPGAAVVLSSSAAASTATALSANLHLVWRDLDSVLLPTRGITLALQGGAGQARHPGGPDGPFARLHGRFTGYLPLGQNWYGQARLEAGQIIKRDAVVVPDALGFRAGGDDSVRGYAYRSLTPVDEAGGTVSGLNVLTASVEVARPILASMPSVWGALFIDAGRAVTHWRDFKPALGYGVGLRWRSPIGPLRADLAWADELKKLRLHLSVGIAF